MSSVPCRRHFSQGLRGGTSECTCHMGVQAFPGRCWGAGSPTAWVWATSLGTVQQAQTSSSGQAPNILAEHPGSSSASGWSTGFWKARRRQAQLRRNLRGAQHTGGLAMQLELTGRGHDGRFLLVATVICRKHGLNCSPMPFRFQLTASNAVCRATARKSLSQTSNGLPVPPKRALGKQRLPGLWSKALLSIQGSSSTQPQHSQLLLARQRLHTCQAVYRFMVVSQRSASTKASAWARVA